MRRNAVTGQTGSCVLSDVVNHYKMSKRRTVRYWYRKCPNGYWAEIVGPFHSALYGTCSFGTRKRSAKNSLLRNLANNHGYIGTMMFSDIDESDTVGIVDPRLLDRTTMARPITMRELCESAGQ